VGGFRINNIRIIEREVVNKGFFKNKKMVLFPNHKGTNQDGEIEYTDIIKFGRDEEEGRKIKGVISNMILEGLKQEGRTIKISKETEFEIDKEFVSAYITPTPNSEKILGVGTIYYGGLLSVRPVYLKEAINIETNEKFNMVNFEARLDKEGKYKEVIYPNQEGLRNKCIEEAMESFNNITQNMIDDKVSEHKDIKEGNIDEEDIER